MHEVPNLPYMTLVPDWVVEVFSSTTQSPDIGKKSAIYARECISDCWVLDTDERSLESFELRGDKFVSMGKFFGDVQVSLPPFDAISFDLGRLWPSLTLN